MFIKGKKRQYLALSVALALGGAWCGGASYQSVAHAADLTITGAGFTPDAANQARDENGAVVGAAAGVENDPAKDTAISGKTTEVSGTGTTYALNAYAGYSIGSGNVTYNILGFKAGTLTGSAYAGYSAGSVTGNTATMIGGTVNTLYGGYSLKGDATHNTVTIEKPEGAAGTLTVKGDVYGAKVMGKGKAEDNTVKIGGAAVIGQLNPTGLPSPPYRPTSGSVIGGQSKGGDVRNNEVTIENDGEVGQFVYGGLTTGDGKAEGNTVKITKGTVIGTLQQGTGGSVWGGRSVNGAVKGNTVEISGRWIPPTVPPVTPPDKPPVTTPGDPYGTYIDSYVYGGLATGNGAVEGNTVTVTGGTVRSQIYGGRSVNGVVKNNVVKISGTAAQTSVAEVSGGKATGDGAAEGNTVEIDSAGVKTGDGGVSGGETANGDAKGNTVTFTKNAAGSEVSHVYGGEVRSGDFDKGHGSATDNTVVLHAGTIDGPNGRAIYGGYAEKDSATGNKVILEKDVVVVDAPVYGGQSEGNGDASDNEVTLRGDNEKAKFYFVYGGKTGDGHAEGNKVFFHGGKVITSLVGGEGDSGASSNEVTIEDGDFSATTDWIIGGRSWGGSTDKNTVTIHKVVHNTLAVAVMGGKGGDSASENTVTLGEMTTTATVTGGSAGKATHPGSANKNIVNLTNVEAGAAVTGGEAIGGSANENKVNMTGGKVTAGDLIGGKTTADATGKAGDANKNVLTLTKVQELQAVTGGVSAQGTASENIVTIDGTDEDLVRTEIKGAVLGGYAAGGAANGNEVKLTNLKAINGDIIGGKSASGEASGNTVNIANATVKSITGGDGATTKNNTVNISGTTVTNKIVGGTQTNDTGNTLNVKGVNTAQDIEGVQKLTFDAQGVAEGQTMLTLSSGGDTKVHWDTLTASGMAVKKITLLKKTAGHINLDGYRGSAKSEITGGNTETNIDVVKDSSNKITDITYQGYQFKGTRGNATVDGTDVYGGRSKAGNTTTDNDVTVASGSHTNVYGGWTTGAGSTASGENAQSHSIGNKVTVSGTASVNGTVYGGFTDVTGGKATGNEVTIDKVSAGSVVGGYGAITNDNIINLRNATVSGSVTGGRGTITNDNIINLRNTTVSGTVTGGTAANGTGNTLAVYYGTGTSSIGDFGGIQNLHFDLENAPTDGTAHTMLNLTSVSGNKTLSDMNIGFYRSGAAKKLKKGDTFTLVENTTAGGSVRIGDNVKAEGKDGSSRSYTFNITTDAAGKLIATVTKAGMGEQSKSIVETRAGASAFLNDGADFTAGPGMDAAKKEARAAAQSGSAPYGVWAGMGGGSLRHETGSHVDMKGWNLGVGWARENAVQAGTLTFGPFIEYGRGSYDSYLDDGTHGSGKTSFLGAGMMAKLETKANTWIDGSLRVGRTKSDYTGLANYDTTSTYYGVQIGAGKDLHVSENDTVGVYVRYSYAHTAGTTAHLSSGETFDFDAVNSHRLRLGTRYTHGMSALSQFYAGLAWEYEFDGDARATSQGDSAPSPSLKGGSALLELGYRFAPQGSRMSYDLSLNGWQGKRQGVTGGVSVKWAF